MKTVLVVDDEQHIRTYLSILVRQTGNATICAKDADEAMTKLKEGPVDLVLLDINMRWDEGDCFGNDHARHCAVR